MLDYFLKLFILISLFSFEASAHSSNACITIFVPRHRHESYVSIQSPQGRTLSRSFGLSEKEVEGLSRWAQRNSTRLFLRFRNPQALRYEGDEGFVPKDSDIPFKSGIDGLVRVKSKAEFFAYASSVHWAREAWQKWERALAAGKYFVDDQGYVRYKHIEGPYVFSDIDVYALVKINSNRHPSLVRIGDGSESIYERQQMMVLMELNEATGQGQVYNLIRHGSQVEHPRSMNPNPHEPLLEIDEVGNIRATDRESVKKLLRGE